MRYVGLALPCIPWLLGLPAQSGLETVGHSTRLCWRHCSHSPAKVIPDTLAARSLTLR